MKITKLERSKPFHMQCLKDPACDYTVSPHRVESDFRRHCSRRAAYQMGPGKYCRQHAGELSLNHLIREQS